MNNRDSSKKKIENKNPYSSKGKIYQTRLRIDKSIIEPDKVFRPQAYFVLNAELDHIRICEEMEILSKVGYGGILTMPYGPLPNSVMDDAWIDAIETMCKKAKKEDLEIWLWDDWCYPSGMAGGIVTANPQYRSKRLYMAIDILLAPGEFIEINAPQKFVAAASCPTNKYGAPTGKWHNSDKGANGNISFKAGSKRERCVVVCWDWFSTQVITVNNKYDVHSVDMLNSAATERFINIIHKQYAARLGHYFGDPIKGFFYDEPSQAFPFPWTDKLPDIFMEIKGYDLIPELPAILSSLSTSFSDPWHNSHKHIRAFADDYLDVWTDMIAKNFYKKLESWCHEQKILSIGHQDMDHRLFNLATVSGHFFKNSSHNDHPGIDVIYNQIQPGRFIDFPRYAGSAARVLGKERALSETGAVMGFGTSPDSIRYVIEHQIIRGINQFFLGSVYYDNSKESIEFGPMLDPWSNPIMKEFSLSLNKRIRRISAISCSGISLIETALYLPIHDIAAMQKILSHPHAGNFGLIWDKINDIAENLTYAFCEFDYIWDEGIQSLDLVNKGFYSQSGIVYTTVILPPLHRIKKEIADRLIEFTRMGGKILVLDEIPEELVGHAIECSGIEDLIKNSCNQVTFEEHHRVSLSGRDDGKHNIWMLLNEDTKPADIKITFPGSGNICEIDLETGRYMEIRDGDSLYLSLHFRPTEFRVFIRELGRRIKSKAIYRAGDIIALKNWLLILPDGTKKSLGNNFPDWCELGFTEFTGWMDYLAEFEWPENIKAGLLELGDVCHAAAVRLDNRDEIIHIPFQPYRTTLRDMTSGKHILNIRVFNTQANNHCGDPKNNYWGRNLDRQKLSSGLFGPVRMTTIDINNKDK